MRRAAFNVSALPVQANALLAITELKGSRICARGRCGQTYYEERDFRDHVVPVPGDWR
jgi:hypothetical protein